MTQSTVASHSDIPDKTETEPRLGAEAGTSFRALLEARRSIRAFSSEPVGADRIDAVLQMARHAPSWCNTQPWRVYVLGGEVMESVKREFVQAAREREAHPDIPFMPGYAEPYLTRKRQADEALRCASRIAPSDLKSQVLAVKRNWSFFGAPHAFIMTVPKAFGPYALLDLGCFLQTVLLALVAENLAGCPQASLAQFPHVLRRHLPIPETEAVACGVSFGYPEPGAPANGCRTSRLSPDEFSHYSGMPTP